MLNFYRRSPSRSVEKAKCDEQKKTNRLSCLVCRTSRRGEENVVVHHLSTNLNTRTVIEHFFQPMRECEGEMSLSAISNSACPFVLFSEVFLISIPRRFLCSLSAYINDSQTIHFSNIGTIHHHWFPVKSLRILEELSIFTKYSNGNSNRSHAEDTRSGKHLRLLNKIS